MSDLPSEELPRRTKVLYGAGDFGFAVSDSVIAILFAIFLTDVVGLKPGLAALAIQFLTGPAPSILLCLGILFAIFYPLDRALHAQTRQKIAAQKKKFNFLKKLNFCQVIYQG